MKKVLYWIPTGIFLLLFGLLLVIFHGIQVIGYNVFGYQGQRNAIDMMMWILNKMLIVVGSPTTVTNLAGDLPRDRPMILVSNHQGMFDIPAISIAMRKHDPKYVAKAALSKGIPSISYNLRVGGSVLIDRKEGKDAIGKIAVFCDYLKANNRAGVIFPEGTRTRNGKMLPFKPMGLKMMLKKMPNATVVPVALENYWHLEKYGLKPIPFGHRLKCTILPAIDRTNLSNDEVVELVEKQIRAACGE